MDIKIRKGIKSDLPSVLALIKELADYENALDQVDVTLSQLEKDGFEGNPYYYLLVAELDDQIIGVCFYFIRYSTWKGKVLFLEDFVVKEEFRRKGIGGMLFEETIRISKKENMDGLHWQVLDWNTPALNFYKKYNATISSTWLNGRLNKEQIKNIKDLIVCILVGGVLTLLGIVIIGDYIVALQENRPVDESVITLMKMSLTGLIGIIAGWMGAK